MRLTSLGFQFALAFCLSATMATAYAGSQADADDAMNFGSMLKGGLATNIGNGTAETAAQSVVPGYSSNPPETAYSGQQTNQSANVANRQAYCAANPTDHSCSALNYSNTVMLPPSLPPTDPALNSQYAVQLPESEVGAIASAYSACSTTTSQVGANVYDRQYCNEYFRKTTADPCQKILQPIVQKTDSCVPGTWFASTDIVTHGNGDPWRYAGIRVSAYCDMNAQITLSAQGIATEPGASGYAMLYLDPNTGGPAPQSSNSFYGRSWYYVDEFNGATYHGGGCSGNNCAFSFSTWKSTPARWDACAPGDQCEVICQDPRIPYKITAFGDPIDCDAVPVAKYVAGGTVTRAAGTFYFDRPHVNINVIDSWANACSGVEARVPPGMLLPDGNNSVPPGVPGYTGSPYKCERVNSVCAEGPDTRIIDGVPVYRACWRWDNEFSCIEADPLSDCGQPRFGACANESGSPSCEELDPDTGICLHRKYTYKCLVQSPTTQSQLNCSSQNYCANGICYDTSHPNDPDFVKAVTMMEAMREGGRYLDTASQRIFKGVDNRCKKKLWGAINCCSRANNPMGALSNFMMATNGYAAFTTGSVYMFDTLFAGEIPNAGAVAAIFQPGPWAMVAGFIFAANLSSCDQAEKGLAMKRDQRLCIDLGEYCSSKKKVVGCLEKTHTYCCYNSRLSRIINEQGRPQLGIGLGDSQNPGCDGFTIAQLQSLDFSQIDFSEFYQEIMPAMLNQTQTQSAASAKVSSCYAGAGKC